MRPVLTQRLAGSNLAAVRVKAGISRPCLGQLVGRSAMTIGRWENGTNVPKPNDRVRLASILGVDVDDLFPDCEPAVISAARAVVAARTIADLKAAVAGLRGELALLDGSGL